MAPKPDAQAPTADSMADWTGQSGRSDPPDLPVLIYDGDCGFCTTSARFGQRRLHLPAIAPWQSLELDLYGVTEAECNAAVQWADRDGTVHSGGAAVAQAMMHGGALYRVGGRALQLPGIRRLAEMAYRLVANNRYRLPGSTDSCRIDG